MINALIIDDEPLAISLVREYLAAFPDINVLDEYFDGFAGAKAIRELKPDLIFLDIQMPKISGFEMLELLDELPAVIFTTAFDQYALKAFESQAIDYLLKPFSKDRFAQAVNKYLQSGKERLKSAELEALNELSKPETEQLRSLAVKKGTDIRILLLEDILYLEAYDDYVKVHAADGIYLKKRTLASFEKSLSQEQFIRVHRSYIIPIRQIQSIELLEKDSHVILLKNGVKVPASRNGYERLRDVLNL